MSAPEDSRSPRTDCDVVIVGGGPAGCSAGVFTARYGLDTVIFDRGRSSIQRCAHLENYLGFPGGVDIETFYALMHDHARAAGCEIIRDLAESIDHADGGEGFVVETQDGRRVTTRRVVAATRYGGEYLRPLDADGAMFETHDHHGEEHDRFDRSYADTDGVTEVDGLYVASPSRDADQQAIVAAGRGARVALALVADVRRDRGYPAPVADLRDWARRDAERDDEWRDRDRWREWLDARLPEDHEIQEERWIDLREREIDRRLDGYLSASDIENREQSGQDRLLEHVDDDRILEYAREIEADERPPEPSD